MKSISRITALFFTLFCLSFLSGCGGSTSDPSPSVSQTIFLETGESVNFSVKGDEPYAGPGDNALIYKWTVYKYGDTPSGLTTIGTDVLDVNYLAVEGDEQYGYIGVTLKVTKKVEKTPGLVSVTNSTFRWEVKVGTASQLAPEWSGDFYYNNSNDVESLVGFDAISGDLSITRIGASVLPNLENIQWVGGDVSISYNDGMKSLVGLSLASVQGSLYINGNYSLKTLKGLEHIEFVGGGLQVKNNVQLENINGLNNIESIGETLTVEGNTKLVDVKGLESLNSVTDTLRVYDNDNLQSLQGLNNLQIAGGLQITRNKALMSIQALGGVESLVGDLSINFNSALDSLDGLQNITSVQGDVEISMNHVMSSLQGLDGLENIDGSLKIFNHNVLETLQGLDNVASIGGELILSDNDVLTQISGLQNLVFVGDDFTVLNNPVLCQVDVDGLEQQVIAANGIGGESQFDSNNGCL